MARVLVAGGAGLVGSHLVPELLQRHPGLQVRATYHRTEPPAVPGAEFVCANLEDLNDCLRVTQDCDSAILAVAVSGGAQALRDRQWDAIAGTTLLNMRLLQALQVAPVQRVVCLSSITVYQDSHSPMAESDLDLNLDPPSAHFGVGWANRYIEKLAGYVAATQPVHMTVVRAANVFGPRGRFDPRYSNFIPALIRKAVERQEPFEVWGHPDVTRDVIYVKDFARGVVDVWEHRGGGFETLNLGSERRTTVGEVANLALQAAGFAPEKVLFRGDAPTSNTFRALTCQKARQLIGWQPRYSLEEALEQTTRWYFEHGGEWRR